jgi:hypothetical protein
MARARNLKPGFFTDEDLAGSMARWRLLHDAWKSRLDATRDEGDRLLLLCGISVAERTVWQLQRDAEAAACRSK